MEGKTNIHQAHALHSINVYVGTGKYIILNAIFHLIYYTNAEKESYDYFCKSLNWGPTFNSSPLIDSEGLNLKQV